MATLTQDQMDGADDMGAFSQRVSEADLDRLIADKCSGGCRGDCNQGLQPCEWSAPRRLHDWTEVLPETCETKPRLGPLSSMERRLLNREPTYTVAGVVLFAVFAAVARWIWS